MFTWGNTTHILSSGFLENKQGSECFPIYLVLPLILILLIVLPGKTLADYKFKDEIPVTLNINSRWDYQEDKFRNKGSCSIQYLGMAKLAKDKDEEDNESLEYISKDIIAVYKFEEESIMMDPENECFGKIYSSMSAHGSIPIRPENHLENSESENGWFILDVHLGEVGKFALNQQELAFFGKKWDPLNEPPTDNYYAFVVVNVNMTYKMAVDDGCEHYMTKKGLYPLIFYIDFKELDWCGMSGSYVYDGEEPLLVKFTVVDLPGYKYFGPGGNLPEIPMEQTPQQQNDEESQPQPKAAHATVNWRFGEEPKLPVSYTYLGDYPQNREPGWSEECQGVTHDGSHWFITERSRLWKFPLSYDLDKQVPKNYADFGIRHVGIPPFLKKLGYNHFGDVDLCNGYVFVPLEGSKPCKIVVFNAEDLSFVAEGDLDPAQQDHAAWCAINPSNGFLYSSNSENNYSLAVYRYEIKDGKLILSYLHRLPLHSECGTHGKIDAVQGGVFSHDGKRLYISSNSGYGGGIFVFNPQTGWRIGHIKVDYKAWAGEELEGLTIWDLDQIKLPDHRGKRQPIAVPGIQGQIHLIMIDNVGIHDDDLFFKHFRVPAEKK